MEISFSNWKKGDVSNSRLILVRGSIVVDGCTDTRCFNDITTSCGSRENQWPVHAGVFKAVIHLDEGENSVEFSYQEVSATITLTFSANATDLSVLPLYVICEGHDGRFQAPEGFDNSVESACQRIGMGTLLAQSLFAEKVKEKGFSRKTFQLDNDLHPDSPICQVFHSKLDMAEARKLSQEALWEHLGREIMMSEIGSEKRKYLAFLSCTHWDGSKVVGDPALSGGGLALLGSGTLHTWPARLSEVVSCFTDQRKISSDLLDNSCFRGTYGGCFSTSLGGVCHEVGHMFNLGHTPSGIMSRGFDNIERVFLAVPSPEVKGRPKICETSNLVLVPCLSVAPGPKLARSKSGQKMHSRTLWDMTDLRQSLNPIEDDLTSLTTACAAILAHHLWFNDKPDKISSITYDPIRNIVSSEGGLKVIQIRGSCGSVVKSWEMDLPLVNQFFPPRLKVFPATLVAINTCGFILTHQIPNEQHYLL